MGYSNRYIKTAGGTFDVGNPEGFYSFCAYCEAHPEDEGALQNLMWLMEIPAYANHYRQWEENRDSLKQAQEDPQGAYMDAAVKGNTLDQTGEKFVDNQIARENVESDQAYQTQMRDTSITSAAGQLASLGLSTSNVIQTGGASSGVSSSPAAINQHSAASLKQQARINAFNQKMGLAKSLISAASSMASSGIYGAALGAVRNAGSRIAGAAAHSGLKALESMRPELRNQLMLDNARRESDYISHPGSW